MPFSILLTGASGYIGGTVLDHLKQSGSFSQLQVTCMVRSNDQIETIQQFAPGVKAVKGSLEERDGLEKLAYENDLVLHTASAQDVEAALALARGSAKRVSEGKKAYFVHVSQYHKVSEVN